MKMAFGIVATAFLLTAAGAFAQEPQAAQAQPEEKKICKSEKMTGSLTRVRRTCLTQRQWDQLAESTRREVDRTVRNASTNVGGGVTGGS